MIKINLSTAAKDLDLSNIGGFDFTKVKGKALLLVLLIIYVPDFLIYPMWEQEMVDKNQELQALQGKSSSLKRKVDQAKNFEKQIQDLKLQEEVLGKKFIAVKEAIAIRKNPSSLLLYVARNTPENLWIKELIIDGDTMNIKGEALDYTSIGNFVTSLKSSVFIREANIAGTTSRVRDTDKVRIESFEVKFSIARFDQ